MFRSGDGQGEVGRSLRHCFSCQEADDASQARWEATGGTSMSRAINRTVCLSPARRLMCDVMHFSQKVPLITLERRMPLTQVALARAALQPRPSWFAIFAKAYALVLARRPDLRRSYMTLPWPRLFEHARNIAVLP